MVRAQLSKEEFAAKAAALREQEGIDLVGTKGEIVKNGVHASWVYDEPNLTIQVTHHPFLVTASFCEGEIAAGLREHGVPADVLG